MSKDKGNRCEEIDREIERLIGELGHLTSVISFNQDQIRRLLEERANLQREQHDPRDGADTEKGKLCVTPRVNELTNDDIERYSRQLLLPNLGVTGQLKLKNSSILIVGMGGLGCPAAQYLCAAGCGRIGLLDYDEVERSNFHRQILHTEYSRGESKVRSAYNALKAINPLAELDEYHMMLGSENALPLIEKYDVILDCTDNVPTRYLLNDACVLKHKPLVSGSALQTDGQLTVYNYEDGPCYRCLYPVPPPPETVTNCGDGGVLGAVTGVIGSLQAMEAIKIIVDTLGEVMAGRLLIFDGSRGIFRNIKLRGKRSGCDVCSPNAMITQLVNYEQFCGARASDKDHKITLLPKELRISVEDYCTLQQKPHLLIDVRLPSEFEICRLPGSINVPLHQLLNDKYAEKTKAQLQDTTTPVVVVCRRGNDSQIAVQHLSNKFPNSSVRDIMGGLHAWHYNVDKDFPIY